MANKIEFNKEHNFDFDIDPKTKNSDHLTSSEILDFVERATVLAKKDLNLSFVLVSSLVCEFFRKTKPHGKVLVKYMLSPEEALFSIFQNNKITAKGTYKIAKIMYSKKL